MARDVKAYLSQMKGESADPEIAQHWATIEQYYNTRLWHQLTMYLKTFVHHPVFQAGGLQALYNNFIADFELKLNCVTLVEIVLVITHEISEPLEAITFLESFLEKVKSDTQARVLCKTNIGYYKLSSGQLDTIPALLEEVEELLDSLDGVTIAHAPFYDLSSQYYMLKANHASYYRNALRYLGCKDINVDIPVEEQLQMAFNLSLAALLGEDVYNFGELLAHPVLESLKGTERGWLVDVLYAFNAGDIARFEGQRACWESQPDLSASQDKLFAKIRLLALMELVFKRHAHDRTIKFSTISEVAQIPLENVEYLTMKALATGLVRGTIDQVSQEVTMSWVQPRVLDLSQVASLQTRIADWYGCIQSTINLIKDEVPDVVLS